MATTKRPVYTSDMLQDVHERSHRNLKSLMAHCRPFSEAELSREFDGFGYPSILLQLHHEISCEKYWLGVLHGRMDVDENESEFRTVESLEAYRDEVSAATETYLSGASTDELNTPRPMVTWRERKRILVPAHVIMRTNAHLYHHQGQILAICRLLGKPGEGMDYPIE
jgi:uncharacterized damage-inducible protein DinB